MKLIKFDENDENTYPEFEREEYLCINKQGRFFVCRWIGMWCTDEQVLYYCELPDLPEDFEYPLGLE
jgi:hypothetical protein